MQGFKPFKFYGLKVVDNQENHREECQTAAVILHKQSFRGNDIPEVILYGKTGHEENRANAYEA